MKMFIFKSILYSIFFFLGIVIVFNLKLKLLLESDTFFFKTEYGFVIFFTIGIIFFIIGILFQKLSNIISSS